MIDYFIKRATSDNLLIASGKLDPYNIPKKDLHHFDPALNLYSLYTYEPGADAELVGHIANKDQVALMRKAVEQLDKPFTFGKLDGAHCIIYQCTKAELLSVL